MSLYTSLAIFIGSGREQPPIAAIRLLKAGRGAHTLPGSCGGACVGRLLVTRRNDTHPSISLPTLSPAPAVTLLFCSRTFPKHPRRPFRTALQRSCKLSPPWFQATHTADQRASTYYPHGRSLGTAWHSFPHLLPPPPLRHTSSHSSMDRRRRSSSPEPEAAPEQQLYHEPALTGHVSQLDSSSTRQRQRNTFLSEPSPNHPFTFDFPTLNTDGSVPDITAHQTRRYPPTPPAALSSLGARSRMNRPENMNESEGSFADSQYDMIDDLSEISNDDHDTASITSNGDDGQLTPDEASSEADAGESVLLSEDEQHMPTPPSTTASYVNLPAQAGSSSSSHSLTSDLQQKIKAENDLIDSYMSEDLETPRQSTMPNALSGTWHRPKGKAVDFQGENQSPTKIESDDDEPHRILFLSEHDVPQFEMDQICSKVAASMMSSADAGSNKVVRLPAPPSGIGLPSATAVYGRDRISATLQHCVGAEARSPGSYKLRILDFDGEHTSFFTIGRDAKIDLIKPAVAVFYVINSEAHGQYASWLDAAFDAIQPLGVPVVAILDPYISAEARKSWRKRCIRAKVEAHVYMNADEFLSIDDGPIFEVSKLLPKDQASRTKKSGSKEKRPTEVSWFKLVFMFLVAVTPYLLLPLIPSSTAPALDTAVRREALSVALEKLAIPSTGIGAVNIEHLLPALEPDCVSEKTLFGGNRLNDDCKQDFHYQGLAPNHMIISLPTLPRTPQLSWARVAKSDGRELSFNQSKLIEGVWDITIDPEDAYGAITVNLFTQKPYSNVTASHNFGNRMLHRKTYEKASTDVSKAVSKDVAVMRDAAQSLTSKLSTEVNAGVSATRNMTTQLALYMARDLQIIGNTAASMLGKVAKASNQTATAFSKDFVLVQRDLVKFTKGLSTKVKSKVESAKSNSKALIKNPLALSRGRLQEIKEAFARRRKGSPSNSAVPRGRRNLRERIKKFKSGSALSVVPESAPPSVTDNATDLLSQKSKYKKAMQQLDALTKRVKRQEDNSGKKMSRTDLRKLKKDVKRQEKLVKKMRAEMHETQGAARFI